LSTLPITSHRDGAQPSTSAPGTSGAPSRFCRGEACLAHQKRRAGLSPSPTFQFSA